MTDDRHGDEYRDEYGDEYGDQHGGGTPPSGGRWDPLPQGDYDDGATAFVKLPEGGVDALLASSDSPLAAPGHGYVPPQITVAPATTAGTDPAATGSWAMPSTPSAPVDGTQWQAPDAGQGYGDYAAHHDPYGGAAPYGTHAGQGSAPGQDDRFAYQPGPTGQWDFSQAAQAAQAAETDPEAAGTAPAPGQDVTGQWSIPVAGGDLPDESGEFTTSSLAEQWGTGAPATLPGGAPAPWATQAAGQPWGERREEHGPDTDERSAEDPRPPSAQPAGHPWGDGTGPSAPTGEEHPSGPPHAPAPDGGANGPGPDGDRYASDSADAPHVPGPAGDLSGSAPDDGVRASGSPAGVHGSGSDGGRYASGSAQGLHGSAADEGVRASGSAAGVHGSGSDGGPYAPGPVEGPRGSASADGVPRSGHDGGRYAAESADDPHAPGHADGLHRAGTADGGQTSGPANAMHAPGHDDGVRRSDSGAVPYPSDPADGTAEAATGPVGGSETVTGEPGGAEEAPEGRAEGQADPGEETRGELRPEAPDGPLPDPASTAPGGSRSEGGREHGQEPGGAPHPEPTTGRPTGTTASQSVADEVSGPADAAEADAADGRTGPDGTRSDATDPDPEAAPALTAAEEPPAPVGPQDEHPLASYVLRVNGADRPVTDAWIGESLLYVLRERLGLAGAKDGCSQGECGACNVQVDGRLVASCLVPAVTSAGSEVRTVEGLATDGQPSDVQRALARRGAVQCGFCVPGMAMTVHNLLEGNPAPTELEARQALCGNLCRCSGYRGVLEAVQEVVAEREAHADAEAHAGADPDEPRIPHQAGPGAGGVNPSAFESQPPPDAQDATGPHDSHPLYGEHGNHGQDGGHA
ncbi:2Fe-2S iron-sulfur cluster-binding protein [Streptomyces sp. G3]|uniref:2Fe-2S iron-sulfur cluster-binding protein n=1 Tax=Streptomyces sp. G3 TaxID=690144 RepID=UPI00202EAB31|nr:2Fe-2S iron-sulfur cluster-binding protein [Streptomyces sp. G3]MCM1939716.1 2Fe-2S iron-sulfur cluster-binding protein [Streptomyces sp. G3]